MKIQVNKNISSIYNKSGFTIYLVIIVLSIAAIIISVSLYSINSIRNQASSELKKFQARMLAESGLVRAEYFLSGGDGHSLDWETDSYSENVNTFGTIAIKNSMFGAFSQIVSKGKRLDYECTLKGLFGRDVPELLEPTITLTGHTGGLELKDSSQVSGTVVLFHGGIKHCQAQVIIRESPALPFDTSAIQKLFKNCNQQFLRILSAKNAISGNKEFINNQDSSMVKDTIIIFGDCELNDVDIINKCFAVSGKLTIDQKSRIEQSAFFCEKCEIKEATTNSSLFFSQKKMTIDNGFHNSQFIANDTIQIGKKAQFGNLTLCINYREIRNDSIVSGGVYLEEQSRFNGIMISGIDSIAKKREWRSSIFLGKQAVVNGIIITDHSLFMRENQIKGHIWARRIESSDDKMSYTNFLFSCIVTPVQENFPFPLFGPPPVSIRLSAARVRFERSK